MRALFLLILCACGPEIELDREALCAGEGPSSMVLGTGVGGAFEELVDGDTVDLVSVPQGGWGAKVRARTTGLAEGALAVVLTTYIDGVQSASFSNGAVQLFCQDDGTGLFVDQGVGLDAEEYKTNDQLFPMQGREILLEVTATDATGRVEAGSVLVTLNVTGG